MISNVDGHTTAGEKQALSGGDAIMQTCRGSMAARDATQGRRKAAGNALHGASCLHPRVDRGDTRRTSIRNGGKAETRATTAAGDAKALGRRFAGYGAGGGRGDAGSAARGGWARRGGKRKWRCGPASVRRVVLSIFFVFLGGGGDGWCRRHNSKMVTRHYVFVFSNVHDCALLSRLLRGWQ